MRARLTILFLFVTTVILAQDKIDNITNSSFTVTASSFAQLKAPGVSGTITMITNNIQRNLNYRLTMALSSGSFTTSGNTIPAAAFRVTSSNIESAGITFNPVFYANVPLASTESDLLTFRPNQNNNGTLVTVNYIVGGSLYSFLRTFGVGTYATANIIFRLYEGTSLRGTETFAVSIRINGESIEIVLNNPVINFNIDTPIEFINFSEQTSNNQLTITSTGNFTLQARSSSSNFTGPNTTLLPASSVSIGVPVATSGLGTVNARQNISTTAITLLPSVPLGLDKSIPILYRFTPGTFLLNKKAGSYSNTITYTATQL